MAPDTKLSNEAWGGIARKFELPPQARNSIDGAISFFLITEASQNLTHSPERTKKALLDIAKISGKLRAGLRKLLSNPLAIVVMNKGISIDGKRSNANDRIAQRKLDAEIATLQELELFLNTASGNIAKARPGAARRAIRVAMFVKALDNTFVHYKGRHLKRDSKGHGTDRQFIASVCEAAELKIGPGSIDEALKQVMKGQRGEISARKRR